MNVPIKIGKEKWIKETMHKKCWLEQPKYNQSLWFLVMVSKLEERRKKWNKVNGKRKATNTKMTDLQSK